MFEYTGKQTLEKKTFQTQKRNVGQKTAIYINPHLSYLGLILKLSVGVMEQ